MALTFATAWGAAKEIGGAVATIAGYTAKLKASPDQAAAALAFAMDEISKTCRSVHDGLTRYLGLPDDPHAFDHGITPLLALSASPLSADIEAGKGHCHEIAVAYRDHLEKWFARVLDPTEAVLMKGAFADLGQADAGLFRDLTSVGLALDEGATEAMKMVLAGNVAGARARLKADFTDLTALRLELSKTLTSLRQMQNDFRVLATGVPMPES